MLDDFLRAIAPMFLPLVPAAIVLIIALFKLNTVRLEAVTAGVKSDATLREYIFDRYKVLNDDNKMTAVQQAASGATIKSLEAQLAEARARSSERDILLGGLAKQDEQKARQIADLTALVTAKDLAASDLATRQTAELVALQATWKTERAELTARLDQAQASIVELQNIVINLKNRLEQVTSERDQAKAQIVQADDAPAGIPEAPKVEDKP